MYSFLVLGLIPGTNIAISFQAWIALGVMLALALPGHRLYVRYHQLVSTAARRPLHASQLHRRLHQMAR